MSIANLFRHTFVIEEYSDAAATWGSLTTRTWTPVGDPIHGLIQETSSLQVMGPELGGTVVIRAIAYLPATAAVPSPNAANFRLRAIAPARMAGQCWRVVTDPTDAAGVGHHIEVDVRRIPAEETP